MKRWMLLIVVSILLSVGFALSLHTRFMTRLTSIFMKLIRVHDVRDDAGLDTGRRQAPDSRDSADKKGPGLSKPLPEQQPPADQYLEKQARQGDVIREAEERRRTEQEKNKMRAEDQQERLREQMERMRERTRRD